MRKFMVVMDESSEFLNALYFAALRAERTGAGVVILGIIRPEEFQHWLGVGDTMREEAEERIRVHYDVFKKWMKGKVDIEPELVIRNGRPVDEIIGAISDDPDIGILVLGASHKGRSPGPLVQEVVSKRGGEINVPITIVSGHLSREEIAAIC